MNTSNEPLFPLGDMLQGIVDKWTKDNIPRHAAVLAFYALFAVAPILLLAVEFMELVFGSTVAETLVLNQISSFVNSPETAAWVQTLLNNILPSTATWWVTAGFLIALIYGASSFFFELTLVLNYIWEVPRPTNEGWWPFVIERLKAVLMVLLGSLSMIGGLLITQWASTATTTLALFVSLGSGYATVSYLTTVFVLLTLIFALIYKFVPNTDIAWQDVMVGAAATALLISITRLLIGWYFSYSHITTMFGAASALVVILLWVYYSAQIFFLGAEFTYVYCHLYGTGWDADPVAQETDDFLPESSEEEVSILDEIELQTIAIESPVPTEIHADIVSDEPSEISLASLDPMPDEPVTDESAPATTEPLTRLSQIYESAKKPARVLRDGAKEVGATLRENSKEFGDALRDSTRDIGDVFRSSSKETNDEANDEGPESLAIENEIVDEEILVDDALPEEQLDIGHEIEDEIDGAIEDEIDGAIEDILLPVEDPEPRGIQLRQGFHTIQTIVQRVISLTTGIIRPIRHVAVAVSVIGALSVAALLGIPWWRRRDGDEDNK
ncbi:MAG: YhjD/YihY/BrkB family envelope integrity protein [Chloroflexota bacterium]